MYFIAQQVRFQGLIVLLLERLDEYVMPIACFRLCIPTHMLLRKAAWQVGDIKCATDE